MRNTVLVGFLCAGTSVTAHETSFWTGDYEGYVVCSHVEDNAFGQFLCPFRVRILQDSRNLCEDPVSIVETADAGQPSVYRGKLVVNDTGDIQAGYLEECDARFDYQELVRIFPTTLSAALFGIAADTVFMTKDLPGAEGHLMAEQCRWALTKVSAEAPDIRVCP